MLLLMGFKVGHSTHHRKVQKLGNLLQMLNKVVLKYPLMEEKSD